MHSAVLPTRVDDPINAAILAVSEDQLQGFQEDPFGAIAERAALPIETVIERVRAMLEAGVIRRIRQTLLATNLAQGALVAWQVPLERLDEAFDFMFQRDPFSGHVVIRSTDVATTGSAYRLWTTLKVPQGYSLEKHARFLADQVGATHFRLMPAKCLFVLGVGHVRRKNLPIGSRSSVLADPIYTTITELTELEWRVLIPLKREFTPSELCRDLWKARAQEAGLPLETFYEIAHQLNRKGVIGRFSTFLEHAKPNPEGERLVTRYNALFHWAVPPEKVLEAGRHVGSFHIMTHAYWREGGPEFGNVNIMGVAHGLDKERLLAHKAAIDRHLESIGIPVSYTNVFWGGRSEIKPSEISPFAYRQFCQQYGLDPDKMREG
ncbi:MAG TPA: Lrp/AsnC family transcriptional regulator [Chthonomonas sp.]|uniref:Lrp/AsnC family transcriptional regulator n=1 Tax=Chthonomonas sp. TaxID=2282153 RepID=UPI002B4B68E2|nr:Lrp/AsnC family transcriptional regulator [Chthonomonas sp.]HLI50020.1 Lrp/AsnC family transcriptional regulator [Chthonomonas sp.]